MLFVRSRRRAARKNSGLRGSQRGGRGGGGGWGNTYNGLYGEARPTERDAFFRLMVYERVGKSVKGPTGSNRTDECYVFIKSGKRSIFVIDSYLKEKHL